MKSYVLDANALLSFFEQRGTAANRVGRLLDRAEIEGLPLGMTAVTWGEVVYHVRRTKTRSAADGTLGAVAKLAIEIVPVGVALAEKAANLKAVHGLAYADTFPAALALERDATLVTSDPDFKKLGQKLRVLWLTAK